MNRQEFNNKQEYEVEENFKKNILLSLTDGAIFTFAMGMVPIGTVLIYYMGNFTQSKVLLGLLNSLYWFLFFTPQILMAKKIQAIKYYKPLSVSLGITQRILWLLVGIFTFLFARSHPTLYVILFYIVLSLIGMVSGCSNTVWLVFMARIIPSSRLSNFLSIRASICGILEITGAVVSGIILSYGNFPNNYGYLFIVAFIIMIISMLFYKNQLEPRNITIKPVQMDNKDYFNSLKKILKHDKNFGIYLYSTALIALGKMSLVFQVIYAKDKISITAQEVAVMTTILFITQTVGYMLWGLVVKRKGLKLAGTISGILFIPAILLTWWMPNIWVLYIAVSFFSFAQSYRNSNENKLVINLSPNSGVLPSYIGLRNTILGPFFSLSSLLAGFILDFSSFEILTIISLGLMIMGITLFAFKLKVPELD